MRSLKMTGPYYIDDNGVIGFFRHYTHNRRVWNPKSTVGVLYSTAIVCGQLSVAEGPHRFVNDREFWRRFRGSYVARLSSRLNQ